ncbi:MAG TPA: tetratricopeptide repeat protein, partial [Candidatus Cloacimonetes bacterium]|nr:tetratricopeptide repeat protein [Candidatus Cloacimonadota bacterium]
MKKVFYLLLILMIFAGCAVNKNISHQPNFIAENYFLFGQAAMQQHDFENAVQLYKKAVEADSNNVYLKETLMEVLALKAFFDKSANSEIIELGKIFCNKNIKSEKIYSIIAESYRNEQQNEMAEKCFKKAIKTRPTMRNLTAYYVFQQNTKPSGNIKLLKKAIKLPWDEEKLVLTIAELYSEIDSVKSLEIFTDAYEKWTDETSLTPLLTSYEKQGLQNKVIETIQFHIDNNRILSDPIKIYLIGRYFSIGQYDEILKNKTLCFEVGTHDILKYLFFSAIRKNDISTGIRAGLAIEESGELTEEFSSSFYTYFADLYLSAGDYVEAANNLFKAKDINTIHTYIFKVDLSKDLERKEKIYKLLLQYYNILEDKTKANYLLAIFHTEFEEKEIALELLNKLPDSFINENELNLMVALAYIQNAMDLQKARSLLSNIEGMKITPNELIASLLFGTEHDSIAYSILKDEIETNLKPDASTFANCSILGEMYDTPDSLLIILEKGVVLYPENADLLNAVGYFIAKNELEEKYDEALNYLKKAVSLMPESEMIWDSLAWLYCKQQRYDEALKALRVPLSNEINNSEIAYHIGEIYLGLNKQKKAKYYFNLAVELNNEKQSVQLSKEILSK